MTSVHISSGLVLQRKEMCTFQCVLSSEEEKSSYDVWILLFKPRTLKKRKVYASVRFIFWRREIFLLWPFSSTCFMLFPCASVIKWTGLPLIVFSFHLLDYNEDGDIMCWFCGREVWIEHLDDFHLFNQECHLRMQFLRGCTLKRRSEERRLRVH